jgi:glycosyltransferase
MPSVPKITVITPCFNCAATIGQTMDSVLGQSYSNLEYIVVDGGSTDGTSTAIAARANRLSHLLSGQDQGPYDAMNKGLKLATGELIAVLNSDDFYESAGTIASVMETYVSHPCDILYGNLRYVYSTDTQRVVRLWRSGQFTEKKLRSGWMPPHPATFVRKSLYERVGGYSLEYRIAADYDFFVRALFQKPSLYYLDEFLVRMRLGGLSNQSISLVLLKTSEDLRIIRTHGLGGIRTLVWKNLSKLPQLFTAACRKGSGSKERRSKAHARKPSGYETDSR